MTAENPTLQNDDALLTVPDLLLARARTEPDAAAFIVDGGGILTYKTWALRAEHIAAGLTALGVGYGDRIALVAENESLEDYLCAFAGVVRVAAVAVPISADLPASQRTRALSQCRARLALACGRTLADDGLLDLREVEGRGRISEAPSVRISPDDLAQIIFTSGTTGAPRGIAVLHGDLAAACQRPLTQETPVPASRPVAPRVLQCVPMATNAHQVMVMGALSLHSPVTTVVLPTFDPDSYCRLIAEHRIAGIQLVPATATWLLQSGAPRRYDTSSVAWIGLSTAPAAAPLLRDLATAFPQAKIVNIYTSTEAYPSGVAMEYDPSRPGALGRPGADVMVADDCGNALPRGRTGEVHLVASQRRRSYVDDARATAAVFRDGWTRTGDLGFLDEDGYLHLVDRKTDSINVGGVKVSSIELEEVLLEHEDVDEIAVVGVPHDLLGQQVVAAVVPRAGRWDEPALRKFAIGRLGWQKAPTRFVQVRALPRNANRKVLKATLRRELTETVNTPGPPPKGQIELFLAHEWEAVLGLTIHDATASFFSLGGHSLAAARVLSRVQQAFGVDLPLSALFEAPTVRDLADLIQHTTLGLGAVTDPAATHVHPLKDSLERTGSATEDEPVAEELTSMQWAQWVGEAVSPGSTNMFVAWSFKAGIERDALREAVHELARRHDALRTTMSFDAALRLRPWLRGATPIDIEEVDLRGARSSVRTDRLESLTRRPFDLSTSPLMRTTVVALDEAIEVLLLAFPHVAVDDWSMSILRDELPMLYSASLSGSAPPAGVTQFSTYLRRHERLRRSADSSTEFWQELLRDAPSCLELPIAGNGPLPSTVDVELPSHLIASLRALGAYHQCSLFMVLAAGFATYLGRSSGLDTLLVPSLLAGRSEPMFERTVGYLARSVLLRISPTAHASFVDVLRETREALLAANDSTASSTNAAAALAAQARTSGLPVTWGVEFQSLTAPMSRAGFDGLLEAAPRLRDAAAELAGPSSGRDSAAGALPSRPDQAASGSLSNGTWSGWRVIDRGDDVRLSVHGTFDETALRRVISGYEALLLAVAHDAAATVADLPIAGSYEAELLRGADVDLAAIQFNRLALPAFDCGQPGDSDAMWSAMWSCKTRRLTCTAEELARLIRGHACEVDGQTPVDVLVVDSAQVDAETRRRIQTCRHLEVSVLWSWGGQPVAYESATKLTSNPDVVGRLLRSSGARIVDTRGLPVPVVAAGQLQLAGRRNTDTGLRALILEDGRLELLGPERAWISLRGFSIDSRRIEACLRSIPDVQDVAVLAWPDVESTIKLTAFLVNQGGLLTLTAIQEQVLRELPGFPPPGAAFLCDRIPRAASGAPDTQRLPDKVIRRLTHSTGPPATTVETLLCDAVEDVTGHAPELHDPVVWTIASQERTSSLEEFCARVRAAGLALTVADILASPYLTVRGLVRRLVEHA